ncbi:Phage tail protein [Lysinibacillus sphaericus]|nr:Phage tail protein [Lysinibacillus sphaericus]
MFKLQYTNSRGQSIELFSAPFRLSKVEGLGEVDADVQTQSSPYQDGDTLIDVMLQPRHISIELKIVGNEAAETEANRRRFASVFNPKLGLGELRYVRGSEVKVIKVVAEAVPSFPDGSTNRGSRFQKALLFLKAPDPYWRGLTVTEEPAFEPLFEFPFEGEFELGMQRDKRIIFNDGDSPAPLVVEFFGPATNPQIINNTTGEFLKINQTLKEGERMMIDTGVSSVYFIDEFGQQRNVFPWIDLASTFFKLQIGDNDIEYTADSDIQGAVVNIRYSKLYTAV